MEEELNRLLDSQRVKREAEPSVRRYGAAAIPDGREPGLGHNSQQVRLGRAHHDVVADEPSGHRLEYDRTAARAGNGAAIDQESSVGPLHPMSRAVDVVLSEGSADLGGDDPLPDDRVVRRPLVEPKRVPDGEDLLPDGDVLAASVVLSAKSE